MFLSARNRLALFNLPSWMSRSRHIGGWTWREPRFRTLGKALRSFISLAARTAIEARRAENCRRRVLRWQRAHMVGGRPTRRIPRHIKEQMRAARTARP